MTTFSIKEIRAARERNKKIKPDFQVGNSVIIVKSPYDSVKPGDKAVIKRIIYNHGRKGDHLYIVSGLAHCAFWHFEVQKES